MRDGMTGVEVTEPDGSSAQRGTVIVSGAASGIGASTAGRFASRGWPVVGLDRKCRSEWDVCADVRRIQVDLSDERAVASALDDVGPVTHVASIAGGSDPRELAHRSDPAGLPTDVLASGWAINVRTHHHLLLATREALAAGASGDASFTVCGSVTASRPIGMPGYSSAKAALSGWATSMAVAMACRGVRVNVVAPGTVRTARNEAQWEHDPGRFERIAAGVPLGRITMPDDVARAFVALALDLTAVVGTQIVVDGGQALPLGA